MEKKNYIPTDVEVSDISLAAALCALGYKLKGVFGDRRKSFLFASEEGAGARQAINDYQNRLLRIEPRRYAEELRALKTLIFNG